MFLIVRYTLISSLSKCASTCVLRFDADRSVLPIDMLVDTLLNDILDIAKYEVHASFDAGKMVVHHGDAGLWLCNHLCSMVPDYVLLTIKSLPKSRVLWPKMTVVASIAPRRVFGCSSGGCWYYDHERWEEWS